MMSEEIKVTVCKYPDRPNLVLRYIDPLTGKQKTKSAGTPDEGEAIEAAGKWEDDWNRALPGPEPVDVGGVSQAVRSGEAGNLPRERNPRRALHWTTWSASSIPDRLAKLTTAT